MNKIHQQNYGFQKLPIIKLLITQYNESKYILFGASCKIRVFNKKGTRTIFFHIIHNFLPYLINLDQLHNKTPVKP
jgi:hypothetical protein